MVSGRNMVEAKSIALFLALRRVSSSCSSEKMRTYVGRGVYGGVGFNTGNIWRSFDDFKDRFTLRAGGGVGLALDSIIGPIALDYGAGNGGRHVVYFSAGVPF